MKKPDLRIVKRNRCYCISEVQYNKHGKPIKTLDDECGILAYWMTIKELKESYQKAGEAFKKPILKNI